MRRSLTAVAVALVLAAGTAAPQLLAESPATSAQAPVTRPGTFVLDGAVARPSTISLRDLRARPATTVDVTYRSGPTVEDHTFTGVPLVDLLTEAGPQFDPAVRNDKLRFAVHVTARDAYEAVVAWGEIDREFAATEVLVAYRQDGRQLTSPRLVVPSDLRGGRYVTDVVAVTLIDLGGS